MSDELLTITEVARIYGTSDGALRMALWRHTHTGADPGVPLPRKVRGRYRWLRSDINRHLAAPTGAASTGARR